MSCAVRGSEDDNNASDMMSSMSGETKADSPTRPAKTFSCVRCFERKVKCDKEHPCSGCVRANVECIFRVPPPPRRKKKRTQEDILTERLNQYEQILQQKGINPQNVPIGNGKPKPKPKPGSISERSESMTPSEPMNAVSKISSTTSDSDPRSFVAGRLIWEEGRSRFTENNLWTRVTEEFQTSQDAIHESSDDDDDEGGRQDENEAEDNIDFTLGWTPSSATGRNSHPTPEQIMMLWQVFVDSVNPFTMIIHRPTLQHSLQKAVLNLDRLPRGLEVLMFAIYAGAINSMTDRDVENCLGESKQGLLKRYRSATKAGLARAKFMGSSDVVVLQAFVLHLLAMRDVYDGRTLWTLSGVALRIAEGMGLHKDGTVLGLPPFKTEVRRRLWYQIATLDYRSAELSGVGKFTRMFGPAVSTQAPLNVNDDDLEPDMTEFPTPHNKITDMVLCSLRYEFSTFWTQKTALKGSASNGNVAFLWENYSTPEAIMEHDALIDELEQILEEKYVRYCDPSVPIELMASLVARTALNSMRLIAHHPRRWASDDEIPEKESNLMWTLCVRILEGYVMCMTSKSLQRFQWHTSFYFQWQALIYLLDCIRADPLMPGAEEAWRHIDSIFDIHPNFVADTKKALHVAVGSLCLKAYSAREQVFKREGRFLPARPPEYISMLRRQREAAQAKQNERKARVEASLVASSSSSSHHNQSLADTFVPSASSASNDVINMMGFETATPSPAPAVLVSPPQRALPPFEVPKAHTQQQGQQPAPFWFNSFNTLNSQWTGTDMDWMMMQDTATGLNNQIDWNQWDFLLQDSNGIVGFGDNRTAL